MVPGYGLLRWLLILLFFVTLLTCVPYFIIYFTVINNPALQNGQNLQAPLFADLREALTYYNRQFFPEFWSFVRPLLTVSILLAIVDWFMTRRGIGFFSDKDKTLPYTEKNYLFVFVSLILFSLVLVLSIINTTLLSTIWNSLSSVVIILLLIFATIFVLTSFGLNLNVIAIDKEKMAPFIEKNYLIIFISAMAFTLIIVLSVVDRGLLDTIWNSLSNVIIILLLLFGTVLAISHLGLNINMQQNLGKANVQSIIAIIIVGSMGIVSLFNLQAAALLKDVALVVVGFYFGSRGDRPPQGQ